MLATGYLRAQFKYNVLGYILAFDTAALFCYLCWHAEIRVPIKAHDRIRSTAVDDITDIVLTNIHVSTAWWLEHTLQNMASVFRMFGVW